MEKLITLSKSPKNYVESIEDIYEEKNQLQSEKNEIQAKYNELLSQYDTLKKKLDKIEENYSKKMKLQSQFNQDINELGEETNSLVEEIEKMANVNIKFNNKDYLLSCDDGQEEDLKNLTKFLDKKYLNLKEKLGNIGENKLLLITTIQVIDEYFDLKKKVLSQKNNFENLSKKFKEMKSLAIDYKDGKETEITNLNTELDKFRKMVEESQNIYESMLDKTTRSLEEIIKNTESNPKSSVMLSKEKVRKKFLLIRKKNIFRLIIFFKPLINLIEKKEKNISLYYPSNYEVDTLKLFEILNLRKKLKHICRWFH